MRVAMPDLAFHLDSHCVQILLPIAIVAIKEQNQSCAAELPCLQMGLASQLQHFQQQLQPVAQQGSGSAPVLPGSYAPGGVSQYPQQQFQSTTSNHQYQQQTFPGATQYQQNQQQQPQYAPQNSWQQPQSQSAFPTIQQGWQQGQPGGLQGQQGNFQGQTGSYPGQQGGTQQQQAGYQGQAYQQQAPQANPAPSQDFQGYVMSKLQQMVATNRLHAFYPPQRLQQVVNKVVQVDLRLVSC